MGRRIAQIEEADYKSQKPVKEKGQNGYFDKEEQVHHGEEYGQIIINYDEKNGLVEIEVLNASKFFGRLLTGMIQAKPEGK